MLTINSGRNEIQYKGIIFFINLIAYNATFWTRLYALRRYSAAKKLWSIRSIKYSDVAEAALKETEWISVVWKATRGVNLLTPFFVISHYQLGNLTEDKNSWVPFCIC